MALKAILYIVITFIVWIKTLKEPVYGLAFFAFIFFVRPETIAYNQLNFLHIPLVTGLICLISIFISREKLGKPVSSKLIIVFFVFYLWTVISTFNSAVVPLWRWSQAYFDMLLFCFLMTRILVNKRSVDIFILAILMGALFLSIWGTQQYFLGNYRLEGVGGRRFGSNEFGAIMASIVPFALYKAMGKLSFFNQLKYQKMERIFFLSMCAFFFMAIVFTLSRGAFLGLTAGIGVLWWRSKKRVRNLVVVLCIVVVVLPFLPDSYHHRIESIFSAKTAISQSADLEDIRENIADGAIVGRLTFWSAALEMFSDHPLFGVGLQNFELLTPVYIEGSKNKDTHNTYLKILAELGIVGFCLFSAMVIITFSSLRKTRLTFSGSDHNYIVDYVSVLEASFFAILVSGITSSYNYTEPLYWFMFLAVSLREILPFGRGRVNMKKEIL